MCQPHEPEGGWKGKGREGSNVRTARSTQSFRNIIMVGFYRVKELKEEGAWEIGKVVGEMLKVNQFLYR
jgi:hypothetical protein